MANSSHVCKSLYGEGKHNIKRFILSKHWNTHLTQIVKEQDPNIPDKPTEIISQAERRGESWSLGRIIGWSRPSTQPALNLELLGEIRQGECLLPARSTLQEMGTGLLSMINIIVKYYSANFNSCGKTGHFTHGVQSALHIFKLLCGYKTLGSCTIQADFRTIGLFHVSFPPQCYRSYLHRSHGTRKCVF